MPKLLRATLLFFGVFFPSFSLAAEQWLYLFPAADEPSRQGFVRVSNPNASETTVTVEGFDDLGTQSQFNVVFTLQPSASINFNSQDLELGNSSKGLSGNLEDGVGSWRLRFTSSLGVEIMGLFRNSDGFVNDIQPTGRTTDSLNHELPFVNPGSNSNQTSYIRLINLSDESNEFVISATDDSGAFSDGTVTVDVAPNAVAELTSSELEDGSSFATGALGDGSGKWRLQITSAFPSKVVGLLEDPNGNLSNLSQTLEECCEQSDYGIPQGSFEDVTSIARNVSGSNCPAWTFSPHEADWSFSDVNNTLTIEAASFFDGLCRYTDSNSADSQIEGSVRCANDLFDEGTWSANHLYMPTERTFSADIQVEFTNRECSFDILAVGVR